MEFLYSDLVVIKEIEERAGIVTEKKQDIIDRITEKLTPHKDLIQFFGIFGSLDHDTDTIIVLKGDDSDPCNFSGLKTVTAALKDLPEAFSDQYSVSIFPSFRLQTWVEASSLPQDASLFPRQHQSVHLLLYPDIKRLFLWERPLLVVTLLESLNLIFGNVDEANRLKDGLKVPSLDQSLEYYINLVYETYQLLLTSRIPEASLLAEAFFKLKYIIKFSALEFLYSKGRLPSPSYTIEAIRKALSQFPTVPVDLFDFVDDCLMSGRLPEQQKLVLFFEKIPPLLQSMYKETWVAMPTPEIHLELHPDMRAILKAMQAKQLDCAPQNGYWHQINHRTALIGWLDWSRPSRLAEAATEVFAAHPKVDRIITFLPEADLPEKNGTFSLNTGATFVGGVKQVGNENHDFHDIRFCDNLEDISAINYEIYVEGDFSVSLNKEKSFFSVLNGSQFIVALEQENRILGALLVHGVTRTKCWFRRLFLLPEARGGGAPKNMIRAALFLAAKRGFQSVFVLVAQKIWDKSWLRSLGFVAEKTFKHITVRRGG